MAFYVGISGWRYAPWRGTFYPADLPQRLELSFASRVLSSIEINGTFYSLQKPEYFRKWYGETPQNFIFSVKGPRYITHIKRLVEVEEAVANFFSSGVLCLEEKLGPILWQFPPDFIYDKHKFASFFKLLPETKKQAKAIASHHGARMRGRSVLESKTEGSIRHAVEVRHSSFVNPDYFSLLRKYNLAAVISDSAGRWPLIEENSSDFIYARLHGDKKLYAGGYGQKVLKMWARKFKGLMNHSKSDAYIYFDNDMKVFAPFDAHNLSKQLGENIHYWTEAGLGLKPGSHSIGSLKELTG